MTNHKLSPSDFAFLWDQCKRCFWLKKVKNVAPPGGPFPRVFTILDEAQKTYFRGRHTKDIMGKMPKGQFVYADGWAVSKPLEFQDLGVSLQIRGKYDSILKLDRGGYCLMDFKTTITTKDTFAKYSRQLHSYVYALANPDKPEKMLAPIKKIGLLCFEPTQMNEDKLNKQQYNYVTHATWLGDDVDMDGFNVFLRSVAEVLAGPVPDAGEKCELCAYRDKARGINE